MIINLSISYSSTFYFNCIILLLCLKSNVLHFRLLNRWIVKNFKMMIFSLKSNQVKLIWFLWYFSQKCLNFMRNKIKYYHLIKLKSNWNRKHFSCLNLVNIEHTDRRLLLHFGKNDSVLSLLNLKNFGPKPESKGHVECIVEDYFEQSLVCYVLLATVFRRFHLENAHWQSWRLCVSFLLGFLQLIKEFSISLAVDRKL